MTAPALVARSYRDHSHGTTMGRVALNYEDRFLRRKVLRTTEGAALLVDLARVTSIEDGGALVLEGGGEIAVIAAQEAVIEVTGPDLARLAWHIGNRHTPCQISGDRLLIRRDPVIAHMLGLLGATLVETHAPFMPEGGAYGHGRTHAHAHGATTHVE